MVNKEQEPINAPIPRLVFDESVLDPELPYKVTANMEEFAAFLSSHGMRQENIGEFTVLLKRNVSHKSIWLDTPSSYYGTYDHKDHLFTLATDWAWEEYRQVLEEIKDITPGEKVSTKEALTRRFNEVVLHEAKHAFMMQDAKEPEGRLKSNAKTAALILSGVGLTAGGMFGSIVGLSSVDAPLVLTLATAVIVSTPPMMLPFIPTFRDIRKDQRVHKEVFEFQEKHKDHLRWRSIVALSPKAR